VRHEKPLWQRPAYRCLIAPHYTRLAKNRHRCAGADAAAADVLDSAFRAATVKELWGQAFVPAAGFGPAILHSALSSFQIGTPHLPGIWLARECGAAAGLVQASVHRRAGSTGGYSGRWEDPAGSAGGTPGRSPAAARKG